MNKQVHVAVAVVLNGQQVLISRRAAHQHQGNRWEFPGGKVEPEEPVTQALIRELQEELAIEPTVFEPLLDVQHDYPDKSVLLDVWVVRDWRGHVSAQEGQQWRFIPASRLEEYEFPAANTPIIRAVQRLVADASVQAT